MRKDWEYKKLGEVVAPKNQIQRAAKCFNKTDIIKYLDISSIDNSKYQISAYTEYTLENAPSRAQQKVEINDIIISLVRPNLKNIARIEIKDYSLVASSGFCVLRSTELIDNNYLFYFISSQKYTDYLVRVTAGANYPAVKESDIRDSLIPIPPKPTQLAIVAELDKINELIQLKKQQLKDYDQLAQSIFYEMFGDPVENEKGWEVKKLGEVCETSSGGTPSKTHTEYYENGTIPWLRSGEVSQGYIYDAEIYISELGLNKSSAKIFPKDTVLIAMYGATVGEVGILCNPMCTNQAICGILPNDLYNSEFLRYVLLSHKDKYLSLASGGAQPNISQQIIKSTLIPFIDKPLQQQFAARIEAIERQKQQVSETIKDLETLLASRMQYWFD